MGRDRSRRSKTLQMGDEPWSDLSHTMMMGYFEFETRNEYDNTITGTYKDHTGLTSQIGLARISILINSIPHRFCWNGCNRSAPNTTPRSRAILWARHRVRATAGVVEHMAGYSKRHSM
jgi:hypothetical protein